VFLKFPEPRDEAVALRDGSVSAKPPPRSPVDAPRLPAAAFFLQALVKESSKADDGLLPVEEKLDEVGLE